MKKIIVFYITLCVFSFNLLKAQAYETKMDYNKKSHMAISNDFAYSNDALQSAIISKMNKLGYKPKEEKGLFNKDKGILNFKNAFVDEINTNRNDYIFRVDGKGKKGNDGSTITMIVENNNQDVLANMNADDVQKVKLFLNQLVPDVEAADLELKISAQDDVVTKAQKKLEGLKKDKSIMEDKIKKLQDDIRKNENDQDDAQKNLDNQRRASEDLKYRRKLN